MPKQNPDLFLIKAGDGADPVVYNTLCGLNTRGITLDGEVIDVTTVDCTGSGGKLFVERVAGTSSVGASGSGYFENKAQAVALINSKLTGTGTNDYQIVVPGLGTFEGKFITESGNLGAEINGGAVTMELSLSSTGPITFTAEV